MPPALIESGRRQGPLCHPERNLSYGSDEKCGGTVATTRAIAPDCEEFPRASVYFQYSCECFSAAAPAS